MKKEMFEHEITILKETFSRLLRRKAKTNLKKIINKTHPADLAFTPLILRKLDIDPAIATGPFVTTSVDILGVLLYFMIAGKFLNM